MLQKETVRLRLHNNGQVRVADLVDELLSSMDEKTIDQTSTVVVGYIFHGTDCRWFGQGVLCWGVVPGNDAADQTVFADFLNLRYYANAGFLDRALECFPAD